MAVTINLLPEELKATTGIYRVLSIVRMVGVISLALFLIFGLGLGAFFIFSSVQLNGVNTANNNLKSQLVSLSSTESQFYLLKDRASKIKTAESFPTATKNLLSFEKFSNFQNSNITQLDVRPDKITATISFKSNADLTNFINSISATNVYNNVSMSSFAFNPTSGYSVSLAITSK